MNISSARKTGMLLFLALLPVAGCERTNLYYDDDPEGGVEIKVDWSGLPQGAFLPEGVLITFYDPEKGTNHPFFRETAGGKISMPDGEYDILVYNGDTERLLFRNMDRFETAEAYLETRSRGNVEAFIGEPDPNFAVFSGHVSLATGQKEPVIVKPQCQVSFTAIKVKLVGVDNVKACRGSLSGVSRCLNLSTGTPGRESCTLIFDLEKDGDTYTQKIAFFGLCPNSGGTRAENEVKNLLTLDFLLLDNTVRTFEYDITDKIEPGETPDTGKPLEIEGIEIPDIESPDGGGFDAGIGGWDQEEDIPLGPTK